jgi:hypothetical protein
MKTVYLLCSKGCCNLVAIAVDKLFCCAEAAVRLSGVKIQSEFHSRLGMRQSPWSAQETSAADLSTAVSQMRTPHGHRISSEVLRKEVNAENQHGYWQKVVSAEGIEPSTY